MMGSVSQTTDDGMLEIGGEDGRVGQGRGEYLVRAMIYQISSSWTQNKRRVVNSYPRVEMLTY